MTGVQTCALPISWIVGRRLQELAQVCAREGKEDIVDERRGGGRALDIEEQDPEPRPVDQDRAGMYDGPRQTGS